MIEAIPYLISGVVFGFTAGISPGPLLALVIGETLKHNKAGGIKVAVAPLLTDLPIVVVSLFVLSRLSDYSAVLGIISFAGALFIAYLGYETITAKGRDLNAGAERPLSLSRGIATNALSPHPYLFWLTVGAPITIKAYSSGITAAVFFIAAFYIFLVGSKILIALIIDRSRIIFNNKAFEWTMRFLGAALFVFALIFVKEGLENISII